VVHELEGDSVLTCAGRSGTLQIAQTGSSAAHCTCVCRAEKPIAELWLNIDGPLTPATRTFC
jgi:hypothetical protein